MSLNFHMYRDITEWTECIMNIHIQAALTWILVDHVDSTFLFVHRQRPPPHSLNVPPMLIMSAALLVLCLPLAEGSTREDRFDTPDD